MAGNRSTGTAHALAVAVPAALLAGAYVSQYAFGLYPCEMCWWQRYAHFAALALALVAFVAPARRLWVALSVLAMLASGLIGLFHAGVEYGWWEGFTTCSASDLGGGDPLEAIMNAPLIRCDVAPWTLLGVSLAGFNFLISTAGALYSAAVSGAEGRAMTESDIKRMIRVDHAGEYGATRIYAGQLAVLGERGPGATQIRGMAVQEDAHLARFEALIAARGVRPTALQPFWSVAGYALGAATALLGPEAAMACTAAVEEEIDRHYSRQLVDLEESGKEPELAAIIEDFREDERAHRDAALAAGAERAPAYPLLSGAIRLGCRVAIRLSERI